MEDMLDTNRDIESRRSEMVSELIDYFLYM